MDFEFAGMTLLVVLCGAAAAVPVSYVVWKLVKLAIKFSERRG
jgi:hypothetical protein